MVGYQTVLTLTGEEQVFAIALRRALHINKRLAIICFSLFLIFQAFLNLYKGVQESLKPNIH